MIFCRGCGTQIHETARSCPKCGANQGLKNRQPKDKNIAALWCYFLGALGAHRFYLGSSNDGLIRFLFFWTGIPLLISFIELFILAFTDQDNSHFDRAYNDGNQSPRFNKVLKIIIGISLIFLCIFIIGIYTLPPPPALKGY